MVISYTGRSIADIKPRYYTLELEKCLRHPKDVLYGEPLARSDAVIVVEGPVDVWRIGPGAIATLGTGWTTEQAKRIADHERRFICFDNEIKAQGSAMKLAQWLSALPGITEIITGLDTDPGDLSTDQVRELRAELGL